MKVLLVALGMCLDVTGVRSMRELRGLDGCKAPVLVAVSVCLKVTGVGPTVGLDDHVAIQNVQL